MSWTKTSNRNHQLFKYIIENALPSKLVYIAIDGPAPLAKMAQQRMRCFRSVRDSLEIGMLRKNYGEETDLGGVMHALVLEHLFV